MPDLQAPQPAPGRFWVEYDNDTGPNDGCLVEWWSVIDEQSGSTLCKCDIQADADRIAAMLNGASVPAPEGGRDLRTAFESWALHTPPDDRTNWEVFQAGARAALAAQPVPAPAAPDVPTGPRTEFVLNELRSALSAMLTFFGMDEDEASKPTFDKARQAENYAEIVMRPLKPWERQSLEDFRACVHRWHEKACAKGYDGVEAMCDTAPPSPAEGDSWPCPKCGVERSHFPACAQDGCPLMLNGLTEAETNETASVKGLIGQPQPKGTAGSLTEKQIERAWRLGFRHACDAERLNSNEEWAYKGANVIEEVDGLAGRTNRGDETGGAVKRFGWAVAADGKHEIVPATNGAFVWYDDYLTLWKAQAPAPAPELPQFIRAEVERAIAKAVNPTGMSTHDGKALIGHDKLRYMLSLIDMLAATQYPAVGDEMLEPLVYAAIMHDGMPKTVAEFERAAANVADMLERRAAAQPLPEALPHPGSPEADNMLDALLAEYGHPANAKNAARAGYMAARRLLQHARHPLPASAHAEPVGLGGTGWQPIETAPQDTQLLLAAEFDRPGDWRIKMGYFDSKSAKWAIWGASWRPTRWMPLPAAPGSHVPVHGTGGEA